MEKIKDGDAEPKKVKKKKKTTKKKKVTKKETAKKETTDYNAEHLKMYEDCSRIIRALTKLYLENDIEPDIGELQKLVASIEKIQKGQRVSLGLDKDTDEVQMPKVNIVENLNKKKI